MAQEGEINVASALDRLIDELRRDGLRNILDLDPYFGTVEVPLQKEIDTLRSSLGEDFAFFDEVLADLREEIEIHFEVTEMYEDEEFDQFVEDCRTIKERFTQEHAQKLLERLQNLRNKWA